MSWLDASKYAVTVKFYRATGKHGFLSNLYECDVTVDGITFKSAEHAYQWGKPSLVAIKEHIRAAPYPRLAAIIGHGLFPFDVVPDWNEIKVSRMRDVLYAKFSGNAYLRQKLLHTGMTILIETSKTDAFWGCGKNGNGQNTLGVLLMELREKLRGENDSDGHK